MSDIYSVKKLNNDIKVRVPGSKSITNRALLIAALCKGISVLRGALDSDDSMHFLNCIKTLGFECEKNGCDITIKGCGGRIPNKSAELYVGSAGTAARFLTAMLAFSDGTYVVKSSEQMAKRPMKELLVSLMELGARFTFFEKEYAFPFEVKGIYCGNDTDKKDHVENEEYKVSVNIDKSSQYLSALLMTAPMLDRELIINIEGSRKAKSYVAITVNMMKEFGVETEMLSENEYKVHKASYTAKEYDIEPDMSAACYFYAMAAVNNISATVKGVRNHISQGDIRFLEVLKAMGCEVSDSPDGIKVTGCKRLHGIDVDMSDFSDQTMTLAAIAPFADSPVNIRNVGHIRKQECDRLYAIECALNAMGVNNSVREDGITIEPSVPGEADIETFDDHRVAMAFAVTGTVNGNINICNPGCCKKTFPEYFEVLDSITK